MKQVITGCATDKGIVREKNQDRVISNAAETARGTVAAACVCDGIGSFARSEISAEMVTEGILLWFQSVKDGRLDALSEPELTEDFEATLRELNELVFERGRREKIRLGCTMSALLTVNERYYIFHVGDSRIYLAGERFFQLTQDETVVSVADGKSRTKLTNCIGKGEKLLLNRQQGTWAEGDAFVLGSDGMFKRMDAEDFLGSVRVLSNEAQAQELCRQLVSTAERRGERDNVSCAIVKCVTV